MPDDIVFRERESIGVEIPTIDLLVITAKIGASSVQNVLIDSRSSVNIIFKAAYTHMKLERNDLKPCHAAIPGSMGPLVPLSDSSTVTPRVFYNSEIHKLKYN